jgi:hypothetical protein
MDLDPGIGAWILNTHQSNLDVLTGVPDLKVA